MKKRKPYNFGATLSFHEKFTNPFDEAFSAFWCLEGQVFLSFNGEIPARKVIKMKRDLNAEVNKAIGIFLKKYGGKE